MPDLFAADKQAPAGAVFSPCRQWRYRLWRTWDPRQPYANFLMLNPSTADEAKNDPTVSRSIEFSKRWGYGGLIVTNLFAWRAPDPDAMKEKGHDAIGQDNNRHIFDVGANAGIVIAAWGAHGAHLDRARQVVKFIMAQGVGYKLHHLGLTQEGFPKHPLARGKAFIPYSFQPVEWR